VNAVAKFSHGRSSDSSQGDPKIVTCSILLENGQVFLNTEQHLDTVGPPPLMTVGLRQENHTVMVSFFATKKQTMNCMGGKPLPATLQKPLCTLNLICAEDIFAEKSDCFEMQLSRKQSRKLWFVSTQNHCWQENPH
jgi:hypothetical protein